MLQPLFVLLFVTLTPGLWRTDTVTQTVITPWPTDTVTRTVVAPWFVSPHTDTPTTNPLMIGPPHWWTPYKVYSLEWQREQAHWWSPPKVLPPDRVDGVHAHTPKKYTNMEWRMHGDLALYYDASVEQHRQNAAFVTLRNDLAGYGVAWYNTPAEIGYGAERWYDAPAEVSPTIDFKFLDGCHPPERSLCACPPSPCPPCPNVERK